MTAQLIPYANPLETMLELLLNSVSSPHTRRSYAQGLAEFHAWKRHHRLGFTRATVQDWRSSLMERGLAASTINVRLAAIRKLAREAALNGLLSAETASAIAQVPGARESGTRAGNWLSQGQAQKLLEAPEPGTLKGKRDRAALALLVGCALRRREAAQLEFQHIQQRDGRWVIVDLKGKGGRIRTVPVPGWVKAAIDCWGAAAQLNYGPVLRAMNRHGRITGTSLSEPALWKLAHRYGAEIGVELATHDLRRTCAKLCRRHGGELEQIQLLLGHASVQTTERYLGTRQDLENAPNDHLGLKWRDE